MPERMLADGVARSNSVGPGTEIPAERALAGWRVSGGGSMVWIIMYGVMQSHGVAAVGLERAGGYSGSQSP